MLAQPGPSNWQEPLRVSALGLLRLSELSFVSPALALMSVEITGEGSHTCAESVPLEADLRNAEEAHDGSTATDCRVLSQHHAATWPGREVEQ